MKIKIHFCPNCKQENVIWNIGIKKYFCRDCEETFSKQELKDDECYNE